MGDTSGRQTTLPTIFPIASEQMGYFTSSQALSLGVSRRALSHHARTGALLRIRPGLYRLRDYPSPPREEVMAAWLAVGKDRAVVSHESALDLLDLSDVIPDAIHLIVPRSVRHLPHLPGVRIHTSTHPPTREEVDRREGIRITSPIRTILDAAQYGTGPEQIDMAVRQAWERGWLIPGRLQEEAQTYDIRVRGLIDLALLRAGGQ